MAIPHCSAAISGSSDEKGNHWACEKPTVPGWYWIHMNGCYEIIRVLVEEDAGEPSKCALLVPIEPHGEGETMNVEQMDVEWYGPLDLPATVTSSAAA
jgi:hypothetical protein